MRIKRPKIGDVYTCEIGNGFRYFQYIADDSTQLQSQIIAVFSAHVPDLEFLTEVNFADSEIDFYSHTFLYLGIKDGSWQRKFNAPPVSLSGVKFRTSADSGNPEIRHSDDWWVWEPNTPARHVGVLTGENRASFLGGVMPSANIMARLATGKFSYKYPQPIGDEPYLE